ncbi:MAG: deoxyhypusine synthase [DPANN group archaeon]|nr:deoxyhypusine synthase [DPANN group archaeon]
MEKKDLKPINDIKLNKGTTQDDMVRQMRDSGGFVAKKLGIGVDILQDMVSDSDMRVILSFPAAIISTGCRGIIKDLVKNKLVDAVITTCGTLDHDLARVWRDYYHGAFEMDDKKLHQENINREGNILIPNESYGEILEQKMQPLLLKWYNDGDRDMAPHELVWKFGEALENEENREESITYWAWKNQIPVFIPGPTDGAWGWQMWYFYQQGHKDFNLNLMKEADAVSDFVHSSKRLGALMLGGGISKHHTIWWSQFKEGLDKAVYITTAPEWDGSLSGARLREAVSWGKVKEDADYVTIEGDATVLLPLMIASLYQRL